MSTIAAFEKEITMQLDFLKKFKPQRMLSIQKQKRAVFCGTGDSYASAQLAEIFSQFRAKAHDPLDLVKNRNLLKCHDLYLVSISGNTVTNIQLAKLSKHVTAITSNSKSKLANASKNVILLRFDNAGIQTSGSIGFLSSALTCISLVSKYEIKDVSEIYVNAKKISKKIPLRGKIYVLGNLYTMPIAMFCIAKLYEVLGIDAHYERIEQFSHMGLFSAKKGDTVILFEEKNKHNKKLLMHLQNCGLEAIRIDPPKTNDQGKILFYIFVSELIALYTAKRKKKKECYFIEAKKLRNASSSMIY
jgi:fructoselysine-6-P-deglycase FrlB-like protein